MTPVFAPWQLRRAMSATEFRRSLMLLALGYAPAARWLGISERTVYRYATGAAPIPPAIVLLIRCMLAHQVAPLVPRGKPRRRPAPAAAPDFAALRHYQEVERM